MKPMRLSRRRGVISILGIALLGTAAAIVAALAIFAAMDFSRLRSERDQLQNDQYQLAAITQARVQLSANRRVDGPLSLPIEAGSASIQWRPDGANVRAVLTIGQHVSELTFVAKGAEWELQECQQMQ